MSDQSTAESEAALSDAAEVIGRLLQNGVAGSCPEQSQDQWDAAVARAEDWLRDNGYTTP